jgi:hypothetical protein
MMKARLLAALRPVPSFVAPRVKPFAPYFTSFFRSLDPVYQACPSFWSLDADDAICFAVMLLSTLLVWFAILITGPFASVVSYWDGPNYVYAAITLYDIPAENPWTTSFNYDPSYFSCHLPGFPLLIRFWAFFTVGNYYFADILAIVSSSLLLSYSFRRLLLAFGCCASPTYSSCLLAFVPMRLVIYHSVGASEPLFIAGVCFSLIFYRFDNLTGVLFSVWLCCLTRIEGMAVGFAIGVCFVLRLRIAEGFAMFLTFAVPVALMVLHRAMFGDALSYMKFNKDHQGSSGGPRSPSSSVGRPARTMRSTCTRSWTSTRSTSSGPSSSA